MTSSKKRTTKAKRAYERWMYVVPEQVICRICSYGEAPGLYPVADRVLLEHERLPESKGGVILAHINKRRNPLAHVLAAGPDVDVEDLSVGDKVWLDEAAPVTEIAHEDGRTFTLARAGDVLLNYGKDEAVSA